MSRRVLFVSVLGALALGGCATIPQPLQGNYAPVSLESARSGTVTAAPVRWGGQIIQTEPREQQTCFYILAEQLDSQARPERGDEQGLGRFVACKQGFYDPEVFAKGREITVTGTLDGTVQHKIGEYDYTYPRVAANTIYLWPKRPIYVETPSPWGPWGPCDPFWSGWGCGWGYGPWGWGYPPRVIVVPRSPPPPPKKG
ncbi:MAG TPA: Slp family lipoprotein [Rhodanobacteraceae bacterium]|nr:Slp family lipoprotein [Rhodanobacteraceae bacterium]